MAETIGIISSIIGITGAIWASIRFILRPYLEKKRNCRNLINILEEHFQVWRDVSYSFRGNPLMKYEEFLQINRFRSKLRKTSDEKKVFLLRNAVQYGLSGDWGYWVVINKNNKKIIDALIPALDGTAGWRPIWRSAYILEKTFEDKINSLYEKLLNKMKENENVKFAFETMKTTGVERYLQSISRGTQKGLKDKALKVLQEIEEFSKQIEEYTKK